MSGYVQTNQNYYNHFATFSDTVNRLCRSDFATASRLLNNLSESQ